MFQQVYRLRPTSARLRSQRHQNWHKTVVKPKVCLHRLLTESARVMKSKLFPQCKQRIHPALNIYCNSLTAWILKRLGASRKSFVATRWVVEPDVMRGLQLAGATRVTLDVIIPSPTGLTPEKWKQTATLCPLVAFQLQSTTPLAHDKGPTPICGPLKKANEPPPYVLSLGDQP